MSTFISTRNAVGETTLVDDILSGKLTDAYTEYKDDLLSSIGRKAFRNNKVLTLVDCPNLTGSIASDAFALTTALTTFILRNNMVPTLAGAAFANGAIASGTGYIYVPAALIDSYKTATNWSTYAAQFRALEDYTVDGTTTGDLDETKI